MSETQITPEWIDQQLTERFPLVAEDLPSLNRLTEKVQLYAREVGKPPSLQMAAGWASVLESELRERADEATERQREQERNEARQKDEAIEQRNARRQERIDYLGSAESERAQAIEEFRARQQNAEATKPFVPREYTEAEKSAMSSEQYKKLVLGFGGDDLALNQSSESAIEENKAFLRQRTLRRRRNDPLSRALRHEIREGLK